MEVVLVIHLILALAIIALVLLQRSEGGGLGIGGGGGGMGGLTTPHQTANAMTRATVICAALFFCTSLLLSIMAGNRTSSESILDKMDSSVPAMTKIQDDIEGEGGEPSVPASKPAKRPSVPTSE